MLIEHQISILFMFIFTVLINILSIILVLIFYNINVFTYVWVKGQRNAGLVSIIDLFKNTFFNKNLTELGETMEILK